MESLKDILRQRQSIAQPQIASSRLQTYIKKKHRFQVKVSFRGDQLIIHAQNSSQTALLNLEKANLERLISHLYDIRFSLRPPK